MRILLLANYLPDRQASMLRYAEMLRGQLRLRGHAVEVIRPEVCFGRLAGRRQAVVKWLGYLDKFLVFPFFLRSKARGFDVVHICDHSNAMYLPYLTAGPATITCHDLLAVAAAEGRYAEQRTGRTGKVLQGWILKNLRRADAVTCVSTATREELDRLAPSGTRLVRVIGNPLHAPFVPVAESEVARFRERVGLGSGEAYLVHVGGNSWYKNRMGVLRIFAGVSRLMAEKGMPALQMLMAGQPFTAPMRNFVAEQGLETRVLERPGLADADLGAAYTGAEALLFPSLYEGFGWPLIEAQSCGCPVICSDRAPLTEVAGRAALYVDVADEAGAAQQIVDSLADLPGLREAGFANAARFTPERLLPAYEAFWAEAIHRFEEHSGTETPA